MMKRAIQNIFRLSWMFAVVTLPLESKAEIFSKSTTAGENSVLQLAGRWASGVTYAVTARDNYAFIGNGASLDIVNFSNPAFPRRERSVVLPSVIRDLALDGNYLYVANFKGGLRIIDISDYATAAEVGFSISANQALDVAVQDTLVFLAELTGGLRIVNVKNPAAPVQIGSYPSGAARGVAVHGNFVYLADGGYGLKIINISNPKSPQLVGSYTTVDDVRDVTIVDNRAYLANGNSGMLILNVLNPANPLRIGSLDTDGFTEEIEVYRNFALIADTNNGLLVVNIFNPSSPSLLKTFDNGGQTLDLGLSGNLVYLSTYYDGVYALNLSNPANPIEAGFYQTADRSFGIAVEGKYAYVSNNYQGFKVLDISNPATPTELGNFDTNGWANDLLVKKNLVYLSDSRDGFKIFDVSQPNQPEQIAHFPTNNSQGLAMNDTLAFVTDGERTGALPGLWIIDIRDPRNPVKISFLEMYDPLDVAIQGNYAYIADGKRGLKVVDFSVPAAPREIAFYNTGNSASGVAVQQNFAFVTDLNSGLRVVDISDPNKPKGAGGFDQLKRAWEIAVSGKYAAIADNELGLVLLDITTPTNPVLVENYPTGHQANSVLFKDNFLYLTDWEDGAYIFNLEAGNLKPESPTLVTPANNAFFQVSPTQLRWNIPADPDNDLLHFSVELSSTPDFTSYLAGSPFRSRQNSARFNPPPPLAAGAGTCQFSLTEELSEGVYYWRVSAEDDELVSEPASPFHFTIDATPPFTSNHQPSKNAVEVDVTTSISFHLQDTMTGVDPSKISLKINGVPVTPILSGTSDHFIVSYSPTASFAFEQRVVVTINAADNAGNIMFAEEYSFVTASEGNTAPAAPVALSPAHQKFLNQSQPRLCWSVPADLNNDSLHFKVELNNSANWTEIFFAQDSRTQPTGFAPELPVIAGSDSVGYQIQTALAEGAWWWRVAAWDGKAFGSYSTEFIFTIDTTPPFTTNHFPAKGATNVATTTLIRLQVQDLLSGVSATSLSLKINGAAVTPIIAGSALNYTLSYQPETPFTHGSNVTVTLDAADVAGNLLTTDTLQFTVESQPNQPPAAPILVSPVHRQFINTTLPEFTWQVPTDANGDSLHFKLEIDKNQTWEAPEFRVESKINSTGFSPVTPQSQGAGEVTFISQSEIAEGAWWWRVAAWDGQIYSAYSAERQFLVDVTPPFISNYQPSKNAVGVDLATRISFHLEDVLSGVDSSKISLKINGASVTPILSGTSEHFIVSYSPATNFSFEQLVVVTINAADSAGNALATEEYSFVTASEGNTAPAAPIALSPADQKFLNQAQPRLSWTVPTDLNNDSLHFKVELNNSANWTDIFFAQDSRTLPTGFTPEPPIISGSDSVAYQIQTALAEGAWWWRVAAWDGNVFGSYSAELKFTIDQSPPVSVNHNPSRAAEGVPIDSKISFHLTDLHSGVDPSTIQLILMGNLVAPTITGDSADFLISFTPAAVFGYEDTVRISIDASDWVGNPMLTDAYYFITASEANTAPLAPEITSPAAESYIREQQPLIKWNSPTDLNGDALHFKVELDNDHDWTAGTQVFESAKTPTGFTPEPPVIQGSGEISFQPPNPLSEGEWWCRVTAWDGKVSGSFSDERHFFIDLSAPVVFSSTPAPDAVNVAVNTNIEIVLKDQLSGIKHASIRLEINGSAVTPSITGNPNEYRLTYNPVLDFGYEQTVSISVAMEDLAGNLMSPRTFSFTTGAALNTLTATLLAPGTPQYHKAFSVQARLSSQSSNITGVIYYRAGGSKNYFPILMSRQSGDLFTGIIPANEVTERGLEFYLYAADNSGAVRTVPEGAPASPPRRLQTSIDEKMFPNTTPAQVYRLITIPIELTQGQPDAVLTDDLLAYDRNRWRLFRYHANAYHEFTFSDFEDFAPGRGFWLITRQAQQLDTGPGFSVRTDTNFVIQLQPGWNLIGNPFSFTVSWDSVIQHGNIEQPVAFGGADNSAQGFRYLQTRLNPWEGYAVKNLETTPISIEIQPVEATTVFNKPVPEENLMPGEWLLQLTVRCQKSEDTDNFLGQLASAAPEWDPHDFSEVPPIGEYVSLHFPHADWKQHPGNYAADFRTISATGDFWDFSVMTNFTQGEIELETTLLNTLPEQWQIFLVHKNSNQLLEFNSSGRYVFPAQNSDFRLIVGTSEMIENHRLQAQPSPTDFCLFPNYPNPFNPETRIGYSLPAAAQVELVIFNLMGQKIKTLVHARQPAGNFEVRWNGKNERGELAPSGIYWYQLRADEFSFTRKMVLTR